MSATLPILAKLGEKFHQSTYVLLLILFPGSHTNLESN